MLKNRWGRIVNIASVVGRAGQAGQVNYAASKAGLIGLTRSLAREVASRGITVNAVAPGYIETPMTAVLTKKQRTAMMATIPLGRRGNRPGNRQCGRIPGLRCRRLHHRPRARCERRHVHGRLNAFGLSMRTSSTSWPASSRGSLSVSFTVFPVHKSLPVCGPVSPSLRRSQWKG